ncbi:PAS domain S-box protein [Sporomusa rhizae]|uniref:PAS domain S-box protein n=1 Tax=Sporomusa rhizae TaxID=357999 RepID=UPI00352A5B56
MALYITSEYRQIHEASLNHLEQTMSIQQLAIENWLQDNADKIKSLAETRGVKEADYRHMNHTFRTFIDNQKDFHDIIYINNSGISTLDMLYQPGIDFSDREYFAAGLRGENDISDVLIGKNSGNDVIVFSSPARNATGEIHGVIVGAVKIDRITGLLDKYQFGNSGKTYLVSRNGLMLSGTRFSQDSNEKHLVTSQGFYNGLHSGNGTDSYTDFRGVKVLGSYRQINHGHWLLMGEIDESEISEPAHKQIYLMVVGFATIILLSIPINRFLSRRLLIPLDALAFGAQKIQDGHLNYMISPNGFSNSPRELQELCITFNQMAEALQSTMNDVNQANLALHEAEERYRGLVENFLVGVYVLSGQTIVYANQCFSDIFGYHSEELIGRSILDLVIPKDEQTVLQSITTKNKDRRTSIRYQFHGQKADGSTIFIEAIGSSYLQKSKLIVMGTLIDITERKKAEEILRQSHDLLEKRVKERTQALAELNDELVLEIQERKKTEEDLRRIESTNRALLNSIPDFMLRIRRDGLCLSVKPPAKELKIKFSAEQLVGTNIFSFLGKDQTLQFSHYMNAAFDTKETQSYEYEISADNSTRQRECRIVICGEEEVLVIIRDITEQKQAEQKIAEARDKLAHIEKLSTLATISAGIAHEINQPLNAIKVTADTLLYMQHTNISVTPADIYNDLKRISSQVDRIDSIIQHLRSFVRQRQTTNLQPINLMEPLSGALSLIEKQMKLHGIKVMLDIPATLPPILGSITPLEEVFINLLANAMTALDTVNKPDKHVIIKAWHEGNSVFVEVLDNGPGITDTLKEKVFEPFFTTNLESNGMGLGLSIVKSVILSFSGKVSVRPNHMGGATIQFTLPTTQSLLNDGRKVL